MAIATHILAAVEVCDCNTKKKVLSYIYPTPPLNSNLLVQLTTATASASRMVSALLHPLASRFIDRIMCRSEQLLDIVRRGAKKENKTRKTNPKATKETA